MLFKTSSLTLSHLRSELLYLYYRGESRWRGNCLFSENCSPLVKEMRLETSSFPLIIRMSFSYLPVKTLASLGLCYSVVPVMVLFEPPSDPQSLKTIVPPYSLLSFTHIISPWFDFKSVSSNSQLNISLTCHLQCLLSSFFWPHGYAEDI